MIYVLLKRITVILDIFIKNIGGLCRTDADLQAITVTRNCGNRQVDSLDSHEFDAVINQIEKSGVVFAEVHRLQRDKIRVCIFGCKTPITP